MKILNILKKSLFLSAIALLSVSCQKDDDIVVTPIEKEKESKEQEKPTPKDESSSENEGLFKWSKVELQFIDGHSHGMPTEEGGGYFHGNPAVDELEYFNPVQKLIFENKDGKIVPSPKNKIIRWIGINVKNGKVDNGSSLYGLKITYYDENGTIINHKLEGQSVQHFFISENLSKNINASDDFVLPTGPVLNYIYRDTNPIDFEAERGREVKSKLSRSYLGLKGVFHPTEHGKLVNFDLKIILAKVNEKASFNNPPSGGEIFSLSVPVHIFQEDRLIGESLMRNRAVKEYGVSEEIIEKEEGIKVELNPESSPIFM